MNQLFDSGTRSCHGQFLQQGTELHDDRDLARRKILTDADRRDQRKRHKHIRFDIKRGDKPDDRFQNDGQTAENDRDPRHIKRKRLKFQKTAYDCDARDRKQDNILFDSAERQKMLQLFHNLFHEQAPFIP